MDYTAKTEDGYEFFITVNEDGDILFPDSAVANPNGSEDSMGWDTLTQFLEWVTDGIKDGLVTEFTRTGRDPVIEAFIGNT
tara:strand:- start:827 stop:1069 length:243 start_codon:yes stop_codon:yes gene_type:complete